MPDRGKELILANDPIVIGEQKLQNIEYLRLQLDNARPARSSRLSRSKVKSSNT